MNLKLRLIVIFLLITILIINDNTEAKDYKWVRKGIQVNSGNCEISPNGKYFAIGGNFGNIDVYDLNSSSLIAFFNPSYLRGTATDPIIPFTFTQDENGIVLSEYSDNKKSTICKIKDINSGNLIREIAFTESENDSTFDITHLKILNNGNLITAVIQYGIYTKSKIDIWDLNTGQNLHSIEYPGLEIKDVQIDSNLNRFIVMTDSSDIMIYNQDNFLEINRIKVGSIDQKGQFLYLSPEGKYIAVYVIQNGGYEVVLKLFDSNGQYLKTFEDLSQFTKKVCFTNNDSNIVYPTLSGVINRQINNPEIETFLNTNLDVVSDIVGIDVNNLIIYSQSSGLVNIFDLNVNKTINHLVSIENTIVKINFTNDDKYIGIIEGYLGTKTFRLLEKETGNEVNSFNMGLIEPWFEFAPDNTDFIYPTSDNNIVVRDYLSSDIKLFLNGHSNIINSGKFSNDGSKVISTSKDNTVKIWDLKNNKIDFDYHHDKEVLYANFTINPSIIIFVEDNPEIEGTTGNLVLLDINTKEIINTEISKIRLGLDITEDRKYLICSGSNMEIWDLESLTKFGQLDYPYGNWIVTSIDISNDNTYVAGANELNRVILWDLEEKNILYEFKDYPSGNESNNSMLSVCFSNDRKYIVSSDLSNYCLILWENRFIEAVDDNISQNSKDEINIYPNPAQDLLSIELPNKEQTNYDIEIFSSIGQKFDGLMQIDSKSNTNVKLDISSLPNGIYFFVANNNGRTYSKLFVLLR